jgi:hypothetical protein
VKPLIGRFSSQLIALEECSENILPGDRVSVDVVWIGSRIN